MRLPNLVHFAFTDTNKDIQDVGVAAFAAACPNITYLNLSGVVKLDNELLRLMLQRLPRVNFVSLMRNTKLTNDVFNVLRTDISVLRGLELGGKPFEF